MAKKEFVECAGIAQGRGGAAGRELFSSREVRKVREVSSLFLCGLCELCAISSVREVCSLFLCVLLVNVLLFEVLDASIGRDAVFNPLRDFQLRKRTDASMAAIPVLLSRFAARHGAARHESRRARSAKRRGRFREAPGRRTRLGRVPGTAALLPEPL